MADMLGKLMLHIFYSPKTLQPRQIILSRRCLYHTIRYANPRTAKNWRI